MNMNDLFSKHLTYVMKKAGIKAEYNGYTTYGILFNEPTEALQMNNKQYAVNDTSLTFTIATGSLGTIKNNDNILIDDINYKISKYITLNNGLELKMYISKAN